MIKKYIKETDEKLKNIKKENINELKKKHLIKISFVQHERLIYLIITLFFALFTIVSFLLTSANSMFFTTTTILSILLLLSIIYYFYLENNLKKLYKQYDKMV